jgi:hypothetical protein
MYEWVHWFRKNRVITIEIKNLPVSLPLSLM